MINQTVNERKSALVVDDELSVCLGVKKLLCKENFDVDTALSGREALDKLDIKRYDIVITDMMMPVINGMYLLKRIKENWPETSVIMMTGYATIRTAIQAIQSGAFDYIPKPFTPEELRSVTSRAIRKRELSSRKKEAEERKTEEKKPMEGRCDTDESRNGMM